MTTPPETYSLFVWNIWQGDVVEGPDFPRSVYLGFIHESSAGAGGISVWWNVATSTVWVRPMFHSVPIPDVAVDLARDADLRFERIRIALGLDRTAVL